MPIQTLGIFDSVYDWVVNKLINPLMTWLGNILSSIFNWIFEDILQPYVFPVIENLWNSIFVNIANVLYADLYSHYCGALDLLDTLTKGFDVLIGLSDITYIDEHGIQQSDTLLNYVIFHSNMRSIIAGVTFIALALAIMFAIYSVMKSTLDFDFEGKRPVGRVMTATFKTMIAFLMVPLIVWVGMQLLSVVLKATANAISGSSGDMSLGNIILAVSAVNAGKGGWNEAKQEFSLTDPSAPWYKLTHNTEFPNYGYLNFAGDINISEIDYIIGFASAIGCLIITLICLVTFIKRIYDIAVLYIVSPYFSATIVLDDGQKFREWRNMFIGKCISGVGSALGMRIFLMLVPIIMGDEIQFFDNGVLDLAGGYVLKLVFIIGGMYAVLKSAPMLTSLVSTAAAHDERASMGKGAMLLGAATMGARRKGWNKLKEGAGGLADELKDRLTGKNGANQKFSGGGRISGKFAGGQEIEMQEFEKAKNPLAFDGDFGKKLNDGMSKESLTEKYTSGTEAISEAGENDPTWAAEEKYAPDLGTIREEDENNWSEEDEESSESDVFTGDDNGIGLDTIPEVDEEKWEQDYERENMSEVDKARERFSADPLSAMNNVGYSELFPDKTKADGGKKTTQSELEGYINSFPGKTTSSVNSDFEVSGRAPDFGDIVENHFGGDERSGADFASGSINDSRDSTSSTSSTSSYSAGIQQNSPTQSEIESYINSFPGTTISSVKPDFEVSGRAPDYGDIVNDYFSAGTPDFSVSGKSPLDIREDYFDSNTQDFSVTGQSPLDIHDDYFGGENISSINDVSSNRSSAFSGVSLDEIPEMRVGGYREKSILDDDDTVK